MTTTAHEDQYAPEPDPVFDTRAEFIRWAEDQVRLMHFADGSWRPIHNRIRRVTHAHLHLKDERA